MLPLIMSNYSQESSGKSDPFSSGPSKNRPDPFGSSTDSKTPTSKDPFSDLFGSDAFGSSSGWSKSPSTSATVSESSRTKVRHKNMHVLHYVCTTRTAKRMFSTTCTTLLMYNMYYYICTTSSCIFLYIPVYSCIFLYIPVYSCIFLYIPVYSCIFLYIPVYSCTILYLFVPVRSFQPLAHRVQIEVSKPNEVKSYRSRRMRTLHELLLNP